MSDVHLSDNIKAYEAQRHELECDHTGEWVVFHDCELVGLFPDLEAAADEAVARFGQGPYLIRQIGIGPPDLSTSMMRRVLA